MLDIEQIKEKKIGIIFGGPSSEREISIRSADNIYNALKAKNYNAVKIDLDSDIVKRLKEEEIGLAYIILHGSPGEDGTIQGLLDILNIPYTGSGVTGSAIAMNKIVTKQLFAANNIPTPPFCIIDKNIDWDAVGGLGFPNIFKPYSEGSSIGVNKFDSKEEAEELLPGLIEKYKYGIIEKFIKGREITVGVLDEAQESMALPILELISKTEFYDYEAKYTKDMTEFICPADLNEEIASRAKKLAVKTHKSLWCSCVSRVEMIVKGDDIYVLEINTIPGMTQISDLPAEAKAMGIEFNDLVEKILISGLKKYE